MPQWFGHDNKWDYELERNIEQAQQELDNTPTGWADDVHDYDPYSHIDNHIGVNNDLEVESFIEPFNLEWLGDYVKGLTVLLLISKFIRKDYKLTNSDIWFAVLLLGRIVVPELGAVYLMCGAYRLIKETPAIFKSTKSWFKSNVNNRSKLEAELKLLRE